MFDEDGYPTEKSLQRLQDWKISTEIELRDLLSFIQDLWRYSKSSFELKGKEILKLQLHTCGWSGNEDIISALRKNALFWLMSWKKSVRGGHYWFEFRLKILK